jgi:hypothetical protein
VLGRFVFRLRFRSQLSEVLHHRVGINLADGANLLLGFEFAFVLEFLFALTLTQEAAGYIADGAKPAFAFETGFVFEFTLALFFALTLAEEAAGNVADGAEPALTFETGFVL